MSQMLTMNMRITAMLILCSALLGTAVGCSNQPVGPSSQASTRAAGGMSTAAALQVEPTSSASPRRFGNRTPGVVFVTSQGLYYDTFVVRDPLPMRGRFQLIADGQTEFGPGQPGYLGGRWWEDVNGNGTQDEDDHYFLCPLLPPGRPTP